MNRREIVIRVAFAEFLGVVVLALGLIAWRWEVMLCGAGFVVCSLGFRWANTHLTAALEKRPGDTDADRP